MSLAEVRLQDGESLENALRRFKRKVQAEDIIKEVRRHSYYPKPGEKRTSRFYFWSPVRDHFDVKAYEAKNDPCIEIATIPRA